MDFYTIKTMSKQIIFKFIEQINNADINGISLLMTNDHIFIDNIGNEYIGKQKMKEGMECKWIFLRPIYLG